MTKAFRWLWLGQLVSNLGTQCSLYGLGLWSFSRQGQLIDFAAVAFVVQLSKLLVLPLLGRWLGQWPRRRVLVVANAVGALCTLTLAALLLLWGQTQLLPLLPLLALAAMAEAALVLSFASLIPVLVPEPAALARANGLFASADGLVLSAAPFAGSWLVAAAGLPGVLLLDGVTFVVAMASMLLVWTPQLERALPVLSTSTEPPMRLRHLLRQPAARSLLVVGTVLTLVYAATEVIFPAWVITDFDRSQLGLALLLGGAGYVLGFQLWIRWAWRHSRAVLALGLIAQSLILMGAGLVLFQDMVVIWFGGLLLFSLGVPLALSALQSLWQRQVVPERLPQLLAQRYRLEWGARLLAFAGSALLVDGLLRPALAWPHWPAWLIGSLGHGPGRSLAVGLGALGWLLLLALLSQSRSWMRA
ncbi:MAG: MFS transporter [Synechococcaceae bacterium WB9_2_170]|nr:MFS transporter [Synechococcaceae bacterium WB9_2_170]